MNPGGIRSMQFEQAPDEIQYKQSPVHHDKVSDHKLKETVDAESEEFIKLEHNRFKISKSMESFGYSS